jgi:WD40 repeat protein
MNYRIDFSPSGAVLSYVDDGYLTYKVFNGKFTAPDINSTGLQSELYTDFSLDGQFIVIGGAVNKGKDAEGNWNGTKPQGTLYIYDAATAQEKLMISREVDLDEFRYRSVMDNLTFSPDGKFLASLGMGELMIHSPRDGSVLFSTNTGHITEDNNLKDLGLGPPTIDRSATGLAVSPDSQLVAVGTAEGGIVVLNSSDWSEAVKISGHEGLVRSAAFSPDGRYLASGGEDHLIILWNTADWSVAAKYTGHIGEITALAFAVDGKTLASGSGDRTVYLWDLPE